MTNIMKCLCGNQVALTGLETIENDVMLKGNSKEVIGNTFRIEAICSNCKRELNIDLLIWDKNWD